MRKNWKDGARVKAAPGGGDQSTVFRAFPKNLESEEFTHEGEFSFFKVISQDADTAGNTLEASRERNALVLSFPSSLNRLQAASYLAHILGKRTLGMKLQDCRPTRDRPDVCHMAPFIRSDPHRPVEL